MPSSRTRPQLFNANGSEIGVIQKASTINVAYSVEAADSGPVEGTSSSSHILRRVGLNSATSFPLVTYKNSTTLLIR